jgi:uncharacterized protein YbcI
MYILRIILISFGVGFFYLYFGQCDLWSVWSLECQAKSFVGAGGAVSSNKGKLEDLISKAMIQWEKDYKGRGPTEVRTDIIRDMIIVTSKGVLSTAEKHLAKDSEGMVLVKKLRQLLTEQGRAELEDILLKLTSARVVSLHTDISTKTGERIFIFRMDRMVG